jgi:hypothetical protein
MFFEWVLQDFLWVWLVGMMGCLGLLGHLGFTPVENSPSKLGE